MRFVSMFNFLDATMGILVIHRKSVRHVHVAHAMVVHVIQKPDVASFVQEIRKAGAANDAKMVIGVNRWKGVKYAIVIPKALKMMCVTRKLANARVKPVTQAIIVMNAR